MSDQDFLFEGPPTGDADAPDTDAAKPRRRNRKPSDSPALPTTPAADDSANAAADAAVAKLKFEEALARLEAIVAQMEGGELPLEECLKAFEEGIRLGRHCHAQLQDTERKVEILMRKSGSGDHWAPYEADADEASAAP